MDQPGNFQKHQEADGVPPHVDQSQPPTTINPTHTTILTFSEKPQIVVVTMETMYLLTSTKPNKRL